MDQKKGIIPILFDLSVEELGNQKFEFDLFSLSPRKCDKLQDYVQECIAKN